MATTEQIRATRGQVAARRSRPLGLTDVRQARFALPLLVFGGALLILSIFLPAWHITLHAPQYPRGLHVTVYDYKMTGDVHEVNGLNHYIGMMKLEDAARIERSISRVAIPLIALLAVASFWVPGRWKWVAIAPALAFPIIFMADLFAWLYHAGHSLDRHAALSSSIKPFTPHLFGEGKIGQFSTTASFGIGFWLALAGIAIITVATILQRRTRDARA